MAIGFPPVSAIVLTFNEEANLPACLESLRGCVSEVFVVDSGSNDTTVAIAERYGAHVVTHPFETHARQWIWALENLPCADEWVLGLDADQRVTPELREEIAVRFAAKSHGLGDIDGFYVKRRQFFRGRWIRHGGYYPKYLLKLFLRGKVHVDDRDLMDHHFYVAGKTGKLQHDIVEDNQKERDIAFWIGKHNRYALLQAQEEFAGRAAWPIKPALFGTPDQRVLWLKRRWSFLPLYIRPFFYFLYRYFFRLGLLDGKQGFIFHFLQGFWFRLLVDIHLEELKRRNGGSGYGTGRPGETCDEK